MVAAFFTWIFALAQVSRTQNEAVGANAMGPSVIINSASTPPSRVDASVAQRQLPRAALVPSSAPKLGIV